MIIFDKKGHKMGTSLYFWILILQAMGYVKCNLEAKPQDLIVNIHTESSFKLRLTEPLSQNISILVVTQHKELLVTKPWIVNATAYATNEWDITVKGLYPGHSIINFNTTPIGIMNYSSAFVRVTVEKSNILRHISTGIGWIYFFAWSISFYPQIFSNYRRKSVVGLNFDFISLNLIGFVLYSMFNCGLKWISVIEEEYFREHPRGLNPVQINDIFFSLHAAFATLITVIQCFIYEAGDQKISITAKIIQGCFFIFLTISMILAITEVIKWLDFLYYCSYIKLIITLIKYVPQAFYNYKRQSTIGWSIGNIFLDFTGGILSMLQMILNAHNYDDWDSIFGDPTKFGLGFFSVAFDIFFLIQHYVLYRFIKEKVIDLKGRI